MNKRSYQIFIEDALVAVDKIARYTENVNYDDFCQNEMMVDAVLRNLEVLGEAARNVPDEIKVKYPHVPWKRMVGLRNIVIHEYFGIDLENIWKIIDENVPETRSELVKILKDLEES